MKVAHLVIVTPGRCGLYETTRELIAGLRVLGVDSRMVEPGHNKLFPKGYPEKEDRGIPVTDMGWAVNADVIVSHSGYDGTPVAKTSQPIIHVAHGRPRSSFLGEKAGGTPVYSYHYQHNSDERWKSVVTFWPEHVEYLKVMFPDKRVDLIQAPVDLHMWNPHSRTKYDFGGHAGDINVVCTDAWRDDVDPFIPLNAYALWARSRPEKTKLHLYARPDKEMRGFAPIIRRIQDDGNMGEIKGWVKGLEHVYRAADFVVTGNDIDTRTVREAMACGCPVVRVGAKLNGYTVDFDYALRLERSAVRQQAEQNFDPTVTAIQFKRVLDNVS
jgi:glycosyltransferase involved in cell wall biosynthesis